MARIALISLGCAKNTVDSETMLAALTAAGHESVDDPAGADVVVINTCGFIEDAKREAIEQILAAAALKENGGVTGLVVCGCLSQRYRAEIAAQFPEVDAFLGTTSEKNICAAVDAALNNTRYAAFDTDDDAPLFGDRIVSTGPYTAYLKIAEGCDNRCAYCAIPLIRGPLRSIPMEALELQARTLARDGIKELCVIAQDTTAYGTDLYGRRALTDLLERLCRIDGLVWIRLLYCYPDKIDDELLQFIKSNDKIVHYLDIPVQHADDGILRAMGRPGGREALTATVSRIRAALPDVTLRTTVMTGFPGETDEAFENLCLFVSECRFDRLGAFAFSAEEGTRAADLPGQIDPETGARRRDAVMELQSRISARRMADLVGSRITVLIEEYDADGGFFIGRSAADAPDVDGKVFVKYADGVAPGDFLSVEVTDALEYDLIGEVSP